MRFLSCRTKASRGGKTCGFRDSKKISNVPHWGKTNEFRIIFFLNLVCAHTRNPVGGEMGKRNSTEFHTKGEGRLAKSDDFMLRSLCMTPTALVWLISMHMERQGGKSLDFETSSNTL